MTVVESWAGTTVFQTASGALREPKEGLSSGMQRLCYRELNFVFCSTEFSTIEESATERKHTRTRLQVERPNEVADGREGKKSETETEKPSPVLEVRDLT